MLELFEEAFESPGFWILAGVGSAMAILGWLMSKNMFEAALPLWQLIVIVIAIIVSSAIFGRG